MSAFNFPPSRPEFTRLYMNHISPFNLLNFACFAPGLVVFKPYDAQQASGEPPLCLHIHVPGAREGSRTKTICLFVRFYALAPS